MGSETQDVWDRTSERALFNIVPPAVQAAFLLASQKRPDLFGLDEHTLWKKLRSDGQEPNPTDNRIRMAFWLEYDKSFERQKKMVMDNVHTGICNRVTFYRMIDIPSRVAWMVCPPVSYMVKIDEALAFATERMRDILSLDPCPPGAKKDLKLMELQAKIWTMLDMRKNGAPAQRIQQQTLSVSVTDKQAAQALIDNDMDSLNRRLHDLEKKDRALQNIPESRSEVIDVESTVADS